LNSGDTYQIQSHVINYTFNPSLPVAANNYPGPVFAELAVQWDYQQTVSSFNPIGGLRIKSITNYDANNTFINKELYKYGSNESGLGTILTPDYVLNMNHSACTYRFICTVFTSVSAVYAPTASVTYHANTLMGVSEVSGSPVVYDEVTKYDISSSGGAIAGKTIYNYTSYMEDPFLNSSYYVGQFVSSNVWKNGYLESVQKYKSTGNVTSPYSLVNEQDYSYTIDKVTNKSALNLQIKNPTVGGTYIAQEDYINGVVSEADYLEFTFIPYNIPTGLMLLHQITNKDYDASGNTHISNEIYSYDANYVKNMVQKVSTNSKGQLITENYKYPFNLNVTGNAYQKMIDRNIVSPVIQYQKINTASTLITRNVNYSDLNDPTNTNPSDAALLQPATIDEQITNSPTDTRILFNNYDAYGNVIQQQKSNDVFQSYIWDYNSVYPVAKVEGASVDQIAYTSFEANGTGSWNYTGTIAADITPVTGNNYYKLSTGIISKTGLITTNTYIVSYWSQNTSAYSIAGTTTVKTGLTINGWTYFEHQITGVSSVSVSGTGNIDELRLYPKGAQMTTYTYIPLIGMISECDLNNNCTYYEYDDFNRLKVTRDKNRNIIKSFDYQYLYPVN
jgi:hypothetical protein